VVLREPLTQGNQDSLFEVERDFELPLLARMAWRLQYGGTGDINAQKILVWFTSTE
jgi:hypothetical protein